MIHRIIGGIHLSSLEPLYRGVDLGAQYKITHILSVIPGPIPKYYTENYTCKQIEITDEETTNIIQFFPECIEFINSALYPDGAPAPGSGSTGKHQGNILIHCAQGISRSVAVIMAYLMQSYSLSVKNSLHAVRRKSPEVQPNTAFMEQLELFSKMHCTVDLTFPEYKQYLISLALQLDPSGSSLRDLNVFADKPKSYLEDFSYELRCKRCRQVLANDNDVDTHEAPDASSLQSQFIRTAPNSRRIVKAEEASTKCSHHFVTEPLYWMKKELDHAHIEGKFQCPKCETKVGGYSWKGSRCSCGKWMIPAIHLQSAKVDKLKKSLPKMTLKHQETENVEESTS